MKEDAQLICPVSYEDPNEVWSKFQPILLESLPLKDVTWKSPISSSYLTIDKLPLRCLPSSANLFKDTDHAFRWFLAPYINLYLLSAETLDAYKNCKMNVKKWVDMYNGAKKSPWLIIYVPSGNLSVDAYTKIYSRLSNDFYSDRTGDRSVMLIRPPLSIDDSTVSFTVRHGNNTATLNLIQQANNSIADLLSKMREGIVVSFQHRSAMYDSDIRRLDSYRGTIQFDFRTLFLVKESLALMYQMMQLPDKALGQYEELEATLLYAPEGVLLESSDWPMVSADALKPTAAVTESGGMSSGVEESPLKTSSSTNTSTIKPVRPRDALSDACKNGEDVVSYSINLARMKILQKKMSILELHRYVFARQMFFLSSHLERPVLCAEKALSFLHQSTSMIDRRLEERYLVNIRKHETKDLVENDNGGGGGGGGGGGVDESAAAREMVSNLKIIYQLRVKQSTLWILASAIKVVRVCRDLSSKLLLRASSTDIGEITGGSQTNQTELSIDDCTAVVRDTSRILGDLLQFAVSRLHSLIADMATINKESFRLAHDSGKSHWRDNSFSKSTSELQDALERELYHGGFDQDSLSTNSLQPIDNNILVSIALKVRACSTTWALDFTTRHGVSNADGSGCFVDSMHTITPAPQSVVGSQTSVKVSVQEVSLLAMLLKALWELMYIAERPRFVVSFQLRCADLFLCHGMYPRASELLESVLRCGLLVSPERKLPPMLSAVSLQSLGTTQQSQQVGAYDKSLSHLSCGDWLEMRFWILRKLLVCAEMSGDAMKYRVFASQLLHPEFVSAASSSRCLGLLVDLEQFRGSLQNNVVFLCASSNSELRMPFSTFFSFNVLTDIDFAPTFSVNRGVEVVLDEIHPVSFLHIVAGEPDYSLTIKFQSKLPLPLRVDSFQLIYKKFNADSIMTQCATSVHSLQSSPVVRSGSNRDYLLGRSSDKHKTEGDYVQSVTEVMDDEFSCSPVVCSVVSGDGLTILPGSQTIVLRFALPAIGDFRLDRVVISAGSLVFADSMLNLCDSTTSEHNNVSLDFSVSTQLLSSHIDLQRYFDEHRLIKVTAPDDLVQIQAVTPTFSPLDQTDRLSLQLRTRDNETIRGLVVSAQNTSYSDSASEVGSLRPTSLTPRRSAPSGNDSSVLSTPFRNKDDSLRTNSFADPMGLSECPLLVSVSDVSQWLATCGKYNVDDKSNFVRGDTVIGKTIGSTVNSLNFDCIDKASQFLVVLPICPTRSALLPLLPVTSIGSPKCVTTTEGDAAVCNVSMISGVSVTLQGVVERYGCLMPFEVVNNFRINSGEVLRVDVMSPDSCSVSPYINSSNSLQNESVLLQAVVRNLSPVTVQLVGYSFVCGDSSGGITVLDGPNDIRNVEEGKDRDFADITDSSSLVVLAPGEKYWAGFVVKQNSISNEIATDELGKREFEIVFHYRRLDRLVSPSGADGELGSRYLGTNGNFVKRTALPKLSSSQQQRPIPQFEVNVITTPVQLTVGQATTLCFRLSCDIMATGSPRKHVWHFSENEQYCCQNTNKSSKISSNIHDATRGTIQMLSVTFCDSDSWLMTSRTVRQLSHAPLVRELSDMIAPHESSSVSLVFDLAATMIPTVTGILTLPPLLVVAQCTMDKSSDNVSENSSNEEQSWLLYPNALKGPCALSAAAPSLRNHHREMANMPQ